MASFSQRLKQLREENNWSVRHLAKLTGISHSAMTYYEMGERNPKREALEAIADVFNVDMDYLLGNSDIKNLYQLELQTGDSSGLFTKKIPFEFRLDHFGGGTQNGSPANLQLFGNSGQLPEKEKKLLALYNKIEDKEGLLRFIERLAALSEEQQKFVFDNLLQGQ